MPTIIILRMIKNYIIIILILLLTGCSVFTAHGRAFKKAEDANQKGDYYQAVLECVKSIKAKPDFDKPLLLMNDIFPNAINSYNQRINRLLNKERKNWDSIIKSYKEIIYLINIVKDLNTNKKQIWLNSSNLKDYQFELDEIKLKAAEFYYSKANKLMKENRQDSFKKAAESFKKIQIYVPNYKNSDEMYNLSREKAIKRIAIMSFNNKSGTNEFGSIGEEISDAIISKMLKDNNLMEFIEIVSRDQIDQIINEQKLSQSGIIENNQNIDIGRILGVQEMITGKVSRVQVSPVNQIKENKNYTKRVIIDYEYYTDKNGKEKKRAIKGDVTAKAKIYKISRTANMSISVTLLDIETAKILYSNSLNEEYKFEYEWASYSGDKRALTNKVKKLIRKSAETAPSKGTMISELSKKISNKMKKELKIKLN